MIQTFVDTSGFKVVKLEKREVRRALVKSGQLVRKSARRLVSRRAVSGAGQFPGKRTGTLARSIRYKVSKPGLLVRVLPFKIAGMKEFYPAFLHYGVRGRIAPRKNYMTEALEDQRGRIESIIADALEGALTPVLEK